MSEMTNESAEVIHPFHGRGELRSVSPDRQYGVVRYVAGNGHYLRTHRLADLIFPPAPTTTASEDR